MKQFKIITITLVFLSAFSINAQLKIEKNSQSAKANKNVALNLNTSHTNIEIDTWNKNEVKVEAYIESKTLTKEELQEILENWDVEVKGSGDNISISTHRDSRFSWNYNFDFDGEALEALEELQFVMANLPEMPEMPELPELPELPEGFHNVHFDFETYKKDGDAYFEKWGKEYEAKYGADYKDKMKAWAKEFAKTDFERYSKEMESWGGKFGETFGKDYELKMEAWSKKFSEKFDGKWAEEMEDWGEAHMEKRYEHLEKRLKASKRGKVIKTIKIRMPKDAKLKVNVRHGELKIATVIHNLNADLSHATLIATSIDGGSTSINASYSPVLVTNWNLGELKLNYVENAQLKRVNHLMLHSNSSNIVIEELVGNAVINGSFGNLEINKISDAFNNLNLVLENSDAFVTLPITDYNLQYQGDRTRFQHPDKTSKESTSSFSTGNLNSNRTIVINAKYSNVVMQ